jgi:hypothetical protein
MKRIFTLFLLLPFFSYCQTALTGAQIEGAINEAVSKGRVVTASSGSVPESALSSLPVVFRTTIDDHKYDIVVTAMNFTATGSTLEVGARFVPNPEMPDQVLYFNSPAIGFSAKHGFKGEMTLLPEILSSSKNNQLSPEAVSLLAGRNRFFEVIMQSSGNKMVLGLDENTKLSFNCGAFEKLTLSGYLKVFNSVNQENIAGQNINSGLPFALVFPAQTVYDWNDIFLQATVANHFHSQKIKEFGFHFETPNTALIDFSVRQNPAGLPKCSAESGNYWKGVSLGSFNLRLPEIITRKDGAALSKVPSGGLFIDVNGGLIGQAGADKLIALEHGTTAGAQPLDASLEKAYVTFACYNKIDALLSGKIKISGCDAAVRALTTDYLFTFNEASGFSYKLNYKGGNSNMVTNEIKLESGSSLLVELKDNQLFVTQRANFTPSITTTAYNNSICREHNTTLTIAGCPHAIEWSNGANTASITVNPTENTSYSARCYDPYCIEVITNTIDITVYESLDTPALTSSRIAEPYCANIEAEISTAAFCPGILQWSENNGAWTNGESTRKVYYPSISTPQTYTYKTQCKLNDCVSEVSNEITLNILPKPSGPTLTKKPGGWTSCKETELHSTACDNGGILKWYRNEVYLGYMDGYRMLKETENGYYQYKVKCVTPNGCESGFSTENIHIDKCSCTPAPPIVSSPFDSKTAEYGTYIPLHGRSCSGTVIWYNSGDQMVGTGADFSHTEMGGPHYYKATCKDANGCESGFSGYIVINVGTCINPPSAPYAFAKIGDTPISGDVVYEEGTTVYLQAHGCEGGTITWYNSGGAKISNDVVHAISSVGDQYFRATCTTGSNNCESNLSGWVRVQIGKCVTDLRKPDVIVKGTSPFNTGSTVEIEATGCGSLGVEWYNSGNQHIGSGNKYYEREKGRHFHYAKCKAANGCEGAGSSMTDFTIGDCVHTPSAPSISAASLTVSGTQTTTLTATGCTGTVKWSTGETGDQINVGAGSYDARCEVNGCLSWNSNEVTVTRVGGEDPTFSSEAITASMQRNNCPNGQTGSVVSVSSTAGKFTSNVSLADANRLRDEWMQSEANGLANCSDIESTYSSEARAVSLQRNNCTTGQTGSMVSVSTTAGQFTSNVSLADANRIRDEWMQSEANRLGSCPALCTEWTNSGSPYCNEVRNKVQDQSRTCSGSTFSRTILITETSCDCADWVANGAPFCDGLDLKQNQHKTCEYSYHTRTITVGTCCSVAPPNLSQNGNTLVASNCSYTVVWNNGHIGSSLIVTEDDLSKDFSAQCISGNCQSVASNKITVSEITTTTQVKCDGYIKVIKNSSGNIRLEYTFRSTTSNRRRFFISGSSSTDNMITSEEKNGVLVYYHPQSRGPVTYVFGYQKRFLWEWTSDCYSRIYSGE